MVLLIFLGRAFFIFLAGGFWNSQLSCAGVIEHNVDQGDVGFGVGPIGEDESEVGLKPP